MLAIASIIAIYVIQDQPKLDGNLSLEIYKDGDLYQEVDLSVSQNSQITITGGEGNFNVVEIKDGLVRVKEADCPNQVCVKTGWLSMPGQTAFCAPNRLKITIKGKSNEVDALTY